MRYEFLERKVMRAEEYQQAVDIVTQTLKSVAGKHASLLVYGSFLDDRLMPGVSDIDMVLFFWDKFVLPPDLMRNLSHEFRDRFSRLRFDTGWFFDASVVDVGNAQDGRFIPHNDNFSKIFDAKSGDGRLLCGKEFVSAMNPVTLVDPVEARIAYNLQTLRLYLLFGRCNAKWVSGVNPYRELKVFQQVRSLGRKVMQLVDPGNVALAKDKKASFVAMKRAFPAIDFSGLDAIEVLFQDKNGLVDTLMSGETFGLLLSSLTCYEKMVQRIVETMPMWSLRSRGAA